MKPKKNLVYCPFAKKSKQLFHSEKEALSFIKYNSDEIKEISGKELTRCYYCNFCFGWHITSTLESSKSFFLNREKRINNAIDEHLEVINEHLEEIEEIKAISKCIDSRIKNIRTQLRKGEIQEAEALLEICELDNFAINKIGGHFLKSNRSEKKIAKIKNLIEKQKDALKNCKESKIN